MANAGYTTDLSVVASAEAAETWVELVGAAAGGNPDETETENYVHGSGSVSQTMGTATGWKSLAFDLGSPRTIAAGDASFHWLYFGAPLALGTLANSGMGIAIGNSTANWKFWKVRGKDTYAYGGWINVAVDPTCAADGQQGSPTGATQVFGSAINLCAAVSKGNPHAADVIRTGRSIVVTGGGGSLYGTFSGAASANDASGSRWGLCQAIDGGYLVKGRFQIGTATLSADFRNSNTSVLIQDLPRVSPSFTVFDIRNADSRVDWTNISFSSLGTNTRGILSAYNNADINIESCSFTDMDSAWFAPNSTINNSTFRRTDTIVQSGSTIDGCIFDSCRGSMTISSDNPALISNSSFTSDGSNNAIEIKTLGASAAYTLTGLTYSNYAAAGSAASNVGIYNNSGQYLELTINGGDEPSYTDGPGASTLIITGQRILTLTGLVAGSEVRIYSAGTTTELAGIETCDTSFDYPYTFASDTYVDIVVHNVDYLYYRLEDYELLDGNSSLPIQQQTDRQYNNP